MLKQTIGSGRLMLALVLTGLLAPMGRGEALVGVYYYPWHGTFRGGHDFATTLRAKLIPPQPPAIGLYDERNAATVTAHIDQSHRGNIKFWVVSWWGPNSAEDVTLRETIFAHPRAAEMKYAILYETTARLGDAGHPNFANLVPDFQFMAKNIFDDPNYLKVNNRPVVYFYLTRAYFNTQASRDALANLRTTMQNNFGYTPYIVGDDLFGTAGVDKVRARLWDAVTDYDVYGTVLQTHGTTHKALDVLADRFKKWKADANALGVGFVPAATPGFNDSGVRKGHRAAPRYLPDQAEGSLFDRMLEQATLPNLDSSAANMMMITSFNEWHEDTQIEPTAAAPPTSLDTGGGIYAGGYNYSGYGNLYLDILASRTAVPNSRR